MDTQEALYGLIKSRDLLEKSLEQFSGQRWSIKEDAAREATEEALKLTRFAIQQLKWSLIDKHG